jgi:hypothetical protein
LEHLILSGFKIRFFKTGELYLSIKFFKREKFGIEPREYLTQISLSDLLAAAYRRFPEFLVKNFLTRETVSAGDSPESARRDAPRFPAMAWALFGRISV